MLKMERQIKRHLSVVLRTINIAETVQSVDVINSDGGWTYLEALLSRNEEGVSSNGLINWLLLVENHLLTEGSERVRDAFKYVDLFMFGVRFFRIDVMKIDYGQRQTFFALILFFYFLSNQTHLPEPVRSNVQNVWVCQELEGIRIPQFNSWWWIYCQWA